ncbi:hypothetical protein GJAV_G00008630 [Gymnothorax javanicus]|nr:hypothetical protein GJAV_G00008630 [Gymnothorax javanicus]
MALRLAASRRPIMFFTLSVSHGEMSWRPDLQLYRGPAEAATSAIEEKTAPLPSDTASAACRVAKEGPGLNRRTPGMSEFWHKMSCCVVAKPPSKKKRRKIDRSMIGEPMNFVHLTHIGSGEMAEGFSPSGEIQEQMRTRNKGPAGHILTPLPSSS